MAVPTLAKLKTIRLMKLQALLLLGGAFVLAVVIWTAARYRLVSEPEWGLFDNASAVITVYEDSQPVRRFLEQLQSSSSDTIDIAALAPRTGITLYAAADPADGSTNIHSSGVFNGVGSVYPSRLRLIPRDVQAVGFIRLSDRQVPFLASLDEEKAVFHVGRTYRGLIGDGPILNAGRRMRVPPSQEMFYLEKPENASWARSSALLGMEMQRFPALSAFWNLPGRVELTVSASRTESVFQPFSLYYRPVGTIDLPRTMLETYAKDLLADALPHPIDVQLPDGSRMQELRHDAAGVRAEQQQNMFGDIVKFSYPDQKEALYAFYAKSGEAWLTTNLILVQAALLGNIGATVPDDACHKGGAGGFAVVPASILPIKSRFNELAVSIHSLETGMFTICGYY